MKAFKLISVKKLFENNLKFIELIEAHPEKISEMEYDMQ